MTNSEAPTLPPMIAGVCVALEVALDVANGVAGAVLVDVDRDADELGVETTTTVWEVKAVLVTEDVDARPVDAKTELNHPAVESEGAEDDDAVELGMEEEDEEVP